jgi:hypothetical protein
MPSIGQTWVLASSIGVVVEMGILSTLKRLLMESTWMDAVVNFDAEALLVHGTGLKLRTPINKLKGIYMHNFLIQNFPMCPGQLGLWYCRPPKKNLICISPSPKSHFQFHHINVNDCIDYCVLWQMAFGTLPKRANKHGKRWLTLAR